MRTVGATCLALGILLTPLSAVAQSVEKPGSFTFTPDVTLPTEVQPTLRMRQGDVNITEGPVLRDQAFASAPVEFVRTGVLMADVRGAGFLALGTLCARAGSPAFWAGRFSGENFGAFEMWCIFPNVTEGLNTLCLIPYGVDIRGTALSTVVSPYPSPFAPRSFALQREYNSQTHAPQIEERAVEIAPDLRLEYRFREWDRNEADLELYLGGRDVAETTAKREQDGSATLSFGGTHLVLRQPGDDRRTAIVEVVSAPPPAVPQP